MAEQEEKKNQPMPVLPSPSYQSVYSNSASLVRTPFDIRVNFGLTKTRIDQLIVDEMPVVPMVNELQATVIMSPQHAKIFAIFLISEVKKWEDQYGPISVSKELAERLSIEIEETDTEPEAQSK